MSFFNARYKTFSATERTVNVDYVNDTGDTIMVVIMVNDRGGVSPATIYVDNVRLAHATDIVGSGKSMSRPIWAIVPPGSTYRFNAGNNYWWNWQETAPR